MAHIDPTSLPVSLQLDGADELFPLVLDKSLRDLPGKRAVCQGTWQGKPIVAKLFLDSRSATRHWKREKEGILALQKANIRTPLLLYSGRLKDQTPIHIFELLPDAITALEIWQQSDTDVLRLAFLQQILLELEEHHRAGLFQKDLHLNNFLYSKDLWYTIDADTIDSQLAGTLLDLKTRLENLALFFAQLSPEFDSLIKPALKQYNPPDKLSSSEFYHRLIVSLTDKRTRRRHKYVKKSYRTCSEFVRHDNKKQIAVYRRDTDPERIRQLLADPDALIAAGKILKDGKSATVAYSRHPDGDWVIKRYNIKNLWHGLKRCLRPSRAWISWGNAHRLAISGIATPKAIAVIEKRIGPLRWGAYYVCEYIDAPSAAKYFQNINPTQLAADKVKVNFLSLFNIMFHTGIFHGDCKATNFLITDQQPCVIDLDIMREFHSRKKILNNYRIDKNRFLRNWQNIPDLQNWFEKHLPR